MHLTQQFLDSTREPGKGSLRGCQLSISGPGVRMATPAISFCRPQVASGTLQQRMMPVMMEHMLKTAPAGADTKSWRY